MRKLVAFYVMLLLLSLYTQAFAVTMGHAPFHQNVAQRYLAESSFGRCNENRACAETDYEVYLTSLNGNANDLDIDLDGIVLSKEEESDFIHRICYNNTDFCRYAQYFKNNGNTGGIGGIGGTGNDSSPNNPVPEPATMLLFGSGLIMIFILNRRKVKNASHIFRNN